MDIIENLNRNISDFRRDTLEVDQFLTGTLVSYDFFKNQYPKILKEFNEKDRDGEELEGMQIFKNLNSKISNYESDIHTFCFINLIARTEAFLNDVLETLYLWNYNSLKMNNTIDYVESIDRDKTILKFSHSSFKDKLKFLKNKFNLSFPMIEEHFSEIIELFTTRNIILHNNGIINNTYLKLNEGSSFELGAKRIITKEYLKLTFVLLIIIAKSIEEQIKEQMNNASS
jgi:hypothetical protein